MVRPSRPEVRELLIERAARLLARRESVSLRKLVEGTDVSTMAVYTYFGGMPGLLGAVRQEGFVRLADGLRAIPPTDDPVADLGTASATYARTAARGPELYALMFDGSLPLPDAEAADATLHHLVEVIERCVRDGRFDSTTDAVLLANELWMLGHGACMLVATGVLPSERVEPVVRSGLVRLVLGAGDARAHATASLTTGWRLGSTPDTN